MIRSLIGQQGMAENVPSSPSTIVHIHTVMLEKVFKIVFFKSTRQADLRSILSTSYFYSFTLGGL